MTNKKTKTIGDYLGLAGGILAFGAIAAFLVVGGIWPAVASLTEMALRGQFMGFVGLAFMAGIALALVGVFVGEGRR